MGWFDEHLHEFKIGAVRYGAPDPDGGTSVVSELRKTLAKVLDGAETFEYIYDFGDDWRHQISIEKIVPANKYSQLPFCINGAGACPPEDSGGPSGYMEFVEAISDPGHPAHLQMMELYDLVFDPYEFEIDDVNDWLTRVKT